MIIARNDGGCRVDKVVTRGSYEGRISGMGGGELRHE